MANTRKKKTNASRVKPSNQWSWENTVSLLSWLDFSLKYKSIDFKESVVDHLHGAFTLEQVDGKLMRLWNRRGPDEPDAPKDWHDIYSRGSLSLYNIPHGYKEDERNDIARAVEELENNFFLEPSTPNRRLRSRSKVDTASSNQDFRLNTPTVEKNEKAQGQKRKYGTDSLTPSGVKHEIVQVDIDSPKTNKSRKKPKTYSKRDQTRSTRATACSPETLPSLQKQRPSLPARERRSATLIKDSEDSISDTLDEQPDGFNSSREISIPFGPLGTEDSDTCLSPDSQQKDNIRDEKRIRCICAAAEAIHGDGNELIECNKCKISQHTGCLQYLCQECIDSAQQTEPVTPQIVSQIDSSTETDELIDPRLHSAIIKIQELQDNLLDNERELQESQEFVEELNRDIHYLNMAKQQRDEHYGSSIEERMFKQQKQVHNLLNELQARRRLGTFTKLTRTSNHQGATIDIKRAFKEAYHNSHMIFRDLEIKGFPFTPQLQMHDRLLGLAQRVAGSRPDSVPQPKDRELLSIDPVVLLRALTTAALKDWVFEAGFPNFEDDSSSTLAAYRDLLANQDGALALRNLDLAALDATIKKPEFKTLIVPKEAQRLAIQLSQTLAPFFTRHPRDPEELSWDSFATWGAAMKTWKDRQAHLVKLFADALTIKASSCLNIEDYEIVIYAPETKFDSNTMEAERMDGTEDASAQESRVVQICIQAAVFVYARSPVSDDASVSESITPTRNFVRRHENERKGVIPSLKAIVVLAD